MQERKEFQSGERVGDPRRGKSPAQMEQEDGGFPRLEWACQRAMLSRVWDVQLHRATQ